jgi:tetratricopeptide (TPR) repeat protein
MVRFLFACASVFAVSLCSISSGRAADQSAAVREAVGAMQRGDFPSAERTLRAEILAHSGDFWAWSLLGVALDNQKRIPEADEFHVRAVALAPRSAEILNNYGTHLWMAAQYEKAEATFASALAAAPGYFQAMYNLGVMATYTGHFERAREVLESALRQQPENVDVLYRLACVEEASRQWEPAVLRLAQAAKLDPRRADVQKLLALTTTELGALDDAAAAWDRYLKLAPNDEVGRRERGYIAAKMGKFDRAIADLEWFAARHPDDAVGHYELGQAERTVDMRRALAEFDKALALDPKYGAALAARGGLYSQEGKPEAAVKDLELAASLKPDDAGNLDRLGQTYQALDRTDDAVRVLRRAAELNPEDSKTLLHLGRALADAGRTDESKTVMDRFRQLGPEKKQVIPAGLVEYLSLTPEQRHAEYRARVDKAVREHPDDPAAQLAYLKLAIEEHNADGAAAAGKRIGSLKPGAAVLRDAGHALLEANYYGPARELLEQAEAADPAGGSERLELAIATFRAGGTTTGAKAGLAVMAQIPESGRGADYYMARAQMLDAAGKSEDATSDLRRALELDSQRPDLYRQAIRLLTGRGQAPEALKWIDEATRKLPGNREILLMKATTLAFSQRGADAENVLQELQERWPEWSTVWLVHGIFQDTHGHYEEGRRALETTYGVGARDQEANYFLADAALRSGGAGKDAAETAIRQAMELSPGDPWIQALGGRIAGERREYQLAVERYRTAIRLRPRLVEAHRGLAQAYGALGRKQEAAGELEEVRRGSSSAEDSPPYLNEVFQGLGALGK